MGHEAVADFAVMFGIAIPKPKLPDGPAKKRAKKDTNEEEEEKAEEEKEEEDDNEAGYGDRDDLKAQQAFNVVHEKVFGSNAETGLRLVILMGFDQGSDVFEKIYLIEYTPSRVLKERLRSGDASIVSLANLVAPPAQVTRDINKLLKEGFEIESECDKSSAAATATADDDDTAAAVTTTTTTEPGWVAIATCTDWE